VPTPPNLWLVRGHGDARRPGRAVDLGRREGLGFYIQIVTGNMRPDLAFAGIFLLTLLGLALFGLVTLAERLLIPWHISQRRTR